MLGNSLHRRTMSKDCRFAAGIMACNKSQMVRFVLTIIDYDGLNMSSIGRVFRSPLRRRRKMAALPLPVAILDDLISGSANEVMQDGDRKGKGRHLAPPPHGDRKTLPMSWMTPFLAPPSWIQDGGAGNDVCRTSRLL